MQLHGHSSNDIELNDSGIVIITEGFRLPTVGGLCARGGEKRQTQVSSQSQKTNRSLGVFVKTSASLVNISSD